MDLPTGILGLRLGELRRGHRCPRASGHVQDDADCKPLARRCVQFKLNPARTASAESICEEIVSQHPTKRLIRALLPPPYLPPSCLPSSHPLISIRHPLLCGIDTNLGAAIFAGPTREAEQLVLNEQYCSQRRQICIWRRWSLRYGVLFAALGIYVYRTCVLGRFSQPGERWKTEENN